MRGVNKVILVGRATRDTELRTTSSGKPVANLRLATNRVVKGHDGTLSEHPQYHTVVCFDRLAETSQKFVSKGKLVYVEGRLESRSFTDKDGRERVVTEVIASDVQFLSGLAAAEADLPDDSHISSSEDTLDDLPF